MSAYFNSRLMKQARYKYNLWTNIQFFWKLSICFSFSLGKKNIGVLIHVIPLLNPDDFN